MSANESLFAVVGPAFLLGVDLVVDDGETCGWLTGVEIDEGGDMNGGVGAAGSFSAGGTC